MQKKSREPLFLAFFFVLLTGAVVAAFTRGWLPSVASEHGPGIDRIILFLVGVTGVVFILGHLILVWFLIRFRGDDAEYRPPTRRAEWLWALVPVTIMTLAAEGGGLVLSDPVWRQLYTPAPDSALEVEITGKQFEWFVRYPGADGKFGRTKPELVVDDGNFLGLDEDDPAAQDDLCFRGSLHLPVGRPVVVRLRSLDVLHSLAIPAFRVKQDAIPGFTAGIRFTPTTTGTYEIACAELCGLGHYRMRGFVYAKSTEEFNQWLQQQVGWFE